MRFRLILTFILLSIFAVRAQKLTEFTTDTVKFLRELDQYMVEFSSNKETAADYMKQFDKQWKENVIAGYFKEVTMNTANKMLAKRMKPYPFFYSFLNTIMNAIQSNQIGEPFEDWLGVYDKMLKAKTVTGIQDFLDMSENMFKNKTFYKTPSYAFYCLESNFKFIYDSVPAIRFEEITLVGSNPRKDTIAIEGTSCTYYPNTGRIIGKGGLVSWERTGLDREVNAQIKRYNIDCKTGTYSSDSVIFTGKQFFDAPQLGRLTDRIITERGDDSYPRFDSYSKRLVVHDIHPDIDYDGGFGIRGAKFVGSGNPAKIIVKHNGKKFLEVSAKAFGMNKDKITGSPAVIKFFLDKDSIYHPGLSFTYQIEKRLVTILRGDDGLQKTPFLNTFHKYDMYFEQIVWPIDSLVMAFNFLPINFQGEAFFESVDFFSRAKADAVRMGENINPIFKVIDYYNFNKQQKTFSLIDFAKYIKYLANDLRPLVFKMAVYGLVFYNPETDMITVRQRLFDYAEDLKHKHDYDIITLHSVLGNATDSLTGKKLDNAVMNLLNYDITVRGVKMVLLSDTQKVFIFPKNRELKLKRNRKLEFSGTVASGKFEFVGKGFVFDYEQFKLDMKTIDSLKIYVEAFEPDVNGNIPFKKVQTLIEDLSGELRIDAPTNKSGYRQAPSFPIFKCTKESYAYYDKRQIFKGVYNRDKFYFKLDPFTIDSVDNFRNEGLRFSGTFESAGIFPTFKEVLTLQKDYSFGFIRQTPPGGYNIYGGKAKFEKEIRLSNRGLRGGGDFNFSSSASQVPDFIFFPDSANGIATTFDIKEQSNPEFPSAHGDDVKLHFLPNSELLQAFDTKTPFIAYKEKVAFSGRFDLTYKELTGNGKVDFEKAHLQAGKILFVQRRMFSDTCNFHLNAFEEEGITFSTVNVNAKIDFDARIGEFMTNGEGSYVKFDKCQYIAYMDRFKWYMDAEDIELGDTQKKLDQESAEAGLDLEGPEFISVHPKQDSLRFFAPGAKYNLRKYIIHCKNVPYINVADARMFPHNGDVTIFKSAVMDTLKESSILANTVTKYHSIRNATTRVFGRYSYLSSGDYQYIDENEKPYTIHFKSIRPDTAKETISDGEIPEKDNFKFNDYFSFAGRVHLQASQQFLTFDGGTKIIHNCAQIGKSYLKFTGEINPRDIEIPIPKKAVDMKGAPVGTGLFYSPDSNAVYGAFASLQGGRTARDVIEADGLMTYNKETHQYEIANKEKLDEMSLPGNYVSLNTEDCSMFTEGRYNLSQDMGQVKLTSVGNAHFFPVNDSVNFNVMLVVDFFFDNGALKRMAKDFELYAGSLPATPFEGDLFNHGTIELLGKERGDRALSELNLYGNYKRFPDELEKSLVFNDVKFIYNKTAKAYISVGPIGLGNILKNEVFRYFSNSYIQIKKVRGNDVLDIYIEADPNTWYYFNFSRGTMLAVSNNDEFNKMLGELKSKSKKMNVDKGPAYRFDLTNKKKKDLFLDKLKQMGAIKQAEEEEKREE